jgi:hypothetical protein
LKRQFSHVSLQTSGIAEPETARELDAESANPALREERYRSSCAVVSKLARYLANFDGRKNLLWISGDFPPVGGSKKHDNRMPEYVGAMLRELAGAGVAVYPVEVRTEIAHEPFERTPSGSSSNIPLRRRRILNTELSADMEKLAALTGGKSLSNRSQLGEAMFDAMEETRFAYELTFGAPESDWDGKAHRLQVKVGVRDAEVLAPLVYAVLPPSQAGAADDFDSPAIGISAMPEVREGTEAASNLKVFLAARDLHWARDETGWTAKIQVSVGNTIKADTLRLTPSNHDQLATQTVSTQIAVEPSAPAHGLRISVRDSASQRTGSLTMPADFVTGVAP